ncbi:helix-turn-helix domain-containing protein [Neolewinella agarilytica]|uniref:helix-turn-helix domain-containing protein n=1 Tax=Neolewinella agarilytica TaxID=478744 RepID=UPI00235688A0|nr:helix-turn-helix domain-containing protein [Neolewinella agarilytica]
MTLSLSGFFILASVVQGLFIGLAILCAPFFRSSTNNYLAGFILLVSGMTFLGWQEFDHFWPDYFWSLMWEFLIPVLLFQYALRLLQHPYLRAPWLPWLYAPFVVVLVADIIFDLDFSFGVYTLPFPQQHPAYQFYDSLLDSMALWWNIFFFGWIFRIARNDRNAAADKRRWLTRFSIALLLVMSVWFLSDYIQYRTAVEDPYSMLWLALSLLFWYIAYVGVYQLRIVDERAEIGALRDQLLEPATPANVSVGNDYSPALRQLMEEEQLYRNPDLGRQVVAEQLGISEGYLSQVMSTQVGQPFADYINSYRVEEAKRLLSSPEFSPYSLEAIGLEAGFKSRSAFYTCFKKATGTTPGMFRKEVKTS